MLFRSLCMARADQRAAAQRALVAACRRPEWDGVVFGRALANLVTRRSVVVKRAVEPLRQAVAAGAAPALWPALRELVATLLGSAAPTQPGLAEILALAAEAVQQSQAGGPIPALTQFAARPGKSRQFVEARRLAALLNR